MKKAVLFLCRANASRSIMAEALARYYWGSRLVAASAGLRPRDSIKPETMRVLQEQGVSTSGLHPKGLDQIEIRWYDLVVNLAASDLAGIFPPAFQGKIIHWHVRDPYPGRLESFRQAKATIDWLVTEKLPRWLGFNPFAAI